MICQAAKDEGPGESLSVGRGAALTGASCIGISARSTGSSLGSRGPATGEKAMRPVNTEDLVIKLKKLKPIMAARYKAKEIGLFGSFVRGEQSAASDVDILVEFEEEADLFDLVGLALWLEEELQCNVDVIPKRALRPELRGSVLREVVAL